MIPQRQHENGVREQNVATLFGKSAMLAPSFMASVDQQVAQPSRFNAFGAGAPSNVGWSVADFSQFGEASTPIAQVANFSDFGGSYTQVIQPANFSDFGEASTAIARPHFWQMEQVYPFDQPCNLQSNRTLI
jgi:hypothetical protein